MAGFTFVSRESELAGLHDALARPEGELLVINGPAGSGKSHLLRRLRREAEAAGEHFVQLNELDFLLDADLRHYSIMAEVAAVHRSDGSPPRAPLLPNGAQLVESLMTEKRRSPREKLLRLFCAVGANLPPASRFVLLLDFGGADAEDAFPLDYFAQRLPEKVKVVVAKRSCPAGVAEDGPVRIIAELPPLGQGNVRRLVEFHLPGSPAAAQLAALIAERYSGQPMATDLAAKIVSGAPDPLAAAADLPPDAGGLARRLLRALSEGAGKLALCLARVPSGVDIASLRALTSFSDGDLRRLLRSDEVRNTVVTQRTARGPRARLCHELLRERLLADSPETSPEARDFHGRAAAFFLNAVRQDMADIDALNAHTHHLRLSGDKGQFIADFPTTYKAKHSFRLLRQLVDEYTRLIDYCDELGETSIKRGVCLANLGRVFQELGEDDDALGCFRDALELCREQDDTTGTAEQLANLASVHKALGQLDVAAENLIEAARLDDEAGNLAGLAADWNSLGIICRERQEPDEAFRYHQKALELHERLSNEVGIANQLVNMAGIHRELGRLEEARDCYQRAWRIDAKQNALAAQIADLGNLGLVFEDLGEMDKAVSCFQQAIDLARSVADREAEAAHLRTLAAMEHRRGRANEAIQALQQSLEIDRAIGSRTGEAADRQALAAAYQSAGDLTLARDLFDQAARLHAASGGTEGEAAARAALARIDRQLRGESLDDEEPDVHRDQQGTRTILREPAGGDLWSNLELVDDTGDGAEAALTPVDTDADAFPDALDAQEPSALLDLASEVQGSAQREHEQARQRIEELEAELLTYREAIGNLRRERDEARQRIAELEAQLKARQTAAKETPRNVDAADAAE